MKEDYTIGIDLGGSSVKAVAATPEGVALAKTNIDFDPAKPMDWAQTIRSLISQWEAEQGRKASSIGLSAPGLASRDGRSVAYMPGRLHGLEGFDWTHYLQRSAVVPVLNDGHAALVGERWVGAAQGFDDVIMLTLGTGVGGAAIVDGQLLRGNIGRAGHLGHASLDIDGPPDICKAPGSLEVAIGNCTIQQRSKGQFKSTHDLIQAHMSGNHDATEIWLRSVRYLAAGIASFINILDPEAVIVGGGIARAGKALFEPLAQFLDPIEWQPGGQRTRIIPAQLGEFAGAFGSACHAMAAGQKV